MYKHIVADQEHFEQGLFVCFSSAFDFCVVTCNLIMPNIASIFKYFLVMSYTIKHFMCLYLAQMS